MYFFPHGAQALRWRWTIAFIGAKFPTIRIRVENLLMNPVREKTVASLWTWPIPQWICIQLELQGFQCFQPSKKAVWDISFIFASTRSRHQSLSSMQISLRKVSTLRSSTAWPLCQSFMVALLQWWTGKHGKYWAWQIQSEVHTSA